MKAHPNHGNRQETPTVEEGTNLKGDWNNIIVLLLLYTMQALPFGLHMALLLIMKSNNNPSYLDLAIFSLSGWPFSLKLLWAPLVDAIYVHKMGRRKSWLVPVQFLIGAIFIYTAEDIEIFLPQTGKANIIALVYVFFMLNFLSATQDIVVDGWALTMLKKNNVGYASTCNSTGQALGIILGSMLPILLTSEEFCNNYLRTIPDVGGIVTLKSMLYTMGIFFLLITTLVAILKKEKDFTLEENHVELNIIQTYSLLLNILKISGIQILIVVLLTVKIGFAVDNVMTLKLIDTGISKDDIMVVSTAMHGVNMLIPIIVAKYTSGPKSLNVYLNVIPFRLLVNIPFAMFVYFSPMFLTYVDNKVVHIPLFYYVILVFLLSLQHILSCIMFVAGMGFFSRISDPRFGGTYMTLLNTISNLGTTWTSTASLGMLDLLTISECSTDPRNNCSTQDLKNICKERNGNCVITVDGYYSETALCTILGIVWFIIFKNVIQNLQKRKSSHWLAYVRNTDAENNTNSFSMSAK